MRRPWLILSCVLGLLGFGYLAYRDFTDIETGENVPGVSWLPETAPNVSFYRSYSWTAYEFDIPESDFLEWAKRWQVQKIEGEPVGILRCHFGGGRLRAPDDVGGDETEEKITQWADAHEQYLAAREKKIERGYFYEREESDGGGIRVGYDLDIGRAYYQSSAR